MGVRATAASKTRSCVHHALAAVLRLATRTNLPRLVYAAKKVEQALPMRLRNVGLYRVRRWKLLWNLQLEDALQRGLFFRGEGTFRRLSRHMSHTVREGDGVLDIGANIGSFALPVAAHSGPRVVYAFEPAASTFARLRENVALNHLESKVVPVPLALGEDTGRKELRASEHYGSKASSTFTLHGIGDPVEEVAVTSVDRWFEEAGLSQVDVVKVDVEGSEFAVVQGMTNLLNTSARPRSLIVEVIDDLLDQAGASWTMLRDVLQEHGYEPYEPTPGGGLQRVLGAPSVRDVIFTYAGSRQPTGRRDA